MRRRYTWELAFFLITIGWGATFVTVKDAVEVMPPLLFMALRFSIGGVALVVPARRVIASLKRKHLVVAFVAGSFLFSGYAFQTVGVQYTTASNAGFITGLVVVFAPLFGALVLRKAPSWATLTGVGLATAGLFLLTSPGGGLPNRGDVLVLFTAASFAVQLLILGRWAKEIPPVAFAGIQLLVVGVLSALTSLIFEPAAGLGDGGVWVAIAITVVAATTIPFWIQAAGQRYVPPTRTAIIFTGEPVFAAITGAWLHDDPVTALGVAGGALILSGMLVAEILAPEREAV